MAKSKAPEFGTGQQNLPLRNERCISPKRASQIMTATLGHGCSIQSIYRLIESGELRAHRMRKLGWWWIEQDSVLEYIHQVQNEPPTLGR